MDRPANKHVAMTVRRRDRVVVEPVANQRQRRDPCRDLLAGVVGWRQGPLERGKIALQPLGDRLAMAAQAVRHPTTAAVQKISVQRFEALEDRKRNEEVPSRVTDEPLDFALVIALARPAEPIPEEVVRLQLGETARPLPLPAKNASHGDLGVVIKDRLRDAAKEAERPNVAVAEGFCRFSGVADHEAGVRVRQVKSKEVDLW